MSSIKSRVFIKLKTIRWPLVGLIILILSSGVIYPYLEMTETTILVPARVTNKPENILISLPVNELEVRIKGPSFIINHMTASNKEYPLNLSHLKSGKNQYSFNPENLDIPWLVAIQEINPPSVIIHTENEVLRTVPVEIVVTGQPRKGYVFKEAISSIDKIQVKGSESDIQLINTIKTKVIDLTDVSSTYQVEIPLNLSDGVTLTGELNLIQVNIIVNEKIMPCVFENIFIKGINTGFRYTIVPDTLNLIAEGPEIKMEALDSQKDILAYLDLNGLEEGVFVRRATINLPVGVTLVSVKPENFTVRLEKK